MESRGEPATIEEAYEELTQVAFAVWIRLQVAEPKQLVGRSKIAKAIGYSVARSDEILRELKLKGYVKMMPRGNGRASYLVLHRVPILSGPSGFITLSSFTFPPPSVLAPEFVPGRTVRRSKRPCKNSNKNPGLCFQCNDRAKLTRKSKRPCGSPVGHSASLTTTKKQTILLELSNSPKSPKKSGKTRRKKPARSRDQEKSHSLIGREITQGGDGRKVPKTRVKMTDSAVGDVATPADSNHKTDGGKTGGAISLNKIIEIRNKNKAERSKRAKKNAKKKPKVRCSQSRSKVNWDKLDQRGNPAISFSPSAKRRKKMIQILDQPDTNPVKRGIVEKMASEFGRIYSRYRRMLQKQKDSVPSYLLPPQERKYAAKAAEWCIRKCVTPKQVLVYWHLNIGNFAERKMDIPPLVFLSSPANVDTVACASLDGLEAEAKQSKDVGHGFSDEHELDSRLRPALEAAGFETVLYNDRHLLTIQKTAQAIAHGARLFVGAEMKPMVDWAAARLYGKKK